MIFRLKKQRNSFSLTNTKDLLKAFTEFRKNLRGEVTDKTVYTLRQKDRKEMLLELTGIPLKDKDRVTRVLDVGENITERRKAQELLKESEKRFKDVARCSGNWVWEADKDGRYTFVSGDIEKILGYKPEEIIKKTPFDLMPEEESKRAGEIFQKIASEKKPIVDLENWNYSKDGKKICLLTNGVPVLDKDGSLVGYRGVDKDITLRNEMERRLKESEEKFRMISSSAQDGIIMMDDDGAVIYWNEAAERIFGYKPEEIIGKNLHGVIAPERFHEAHKKGFSKFKDTGRGAAVGKTLELSGLRKDGTEFPVELSLSSVKIKDRWVAIGIVRDITERRKAKEQYKILFNSSPDGIMLLTEDGKILSVNPSMAKSLGISAEDLIGRNIHKVLPEDADERRTAAGRKALETGEIQENDDERDGRFFHNIFVPVSTPDSDKSVQVISRDSTDIKKSELLLKEKIDELERFKKVVVGRELQMTKFKERIKELEGKLKEEI